jgi:hypothetical protein
MSDFKKSLLRNSIIIGVVIVISGVFLFLLRANITHQLSVISDLSKRRTMYLESSQGLATLIRQWEEAQQYTNQLFKLVPKKDEIALLSKELQSLAQEKNISLSFSFGSDEPVKSEKEGISSIGFSATFEGKKTDILNLINSIEEKYYALRIQSFNITASGSGDSYRCFVTGQVSFYE